MKTFTNCQTYHTGINDPHTIEINGRLVSISYANKLNRDCVFKYYTETKLFTLQAIAIDKAGNEYKVYADNPLATCDRVIAIREVL